MKSILTCILLISGVMYATAAKESLRIMTYNVPKGNIPAVGINTWENRCIGLQEYINKRHPDLLGMQEPVRDELMNLLSGMPAYSMLGVARDNGAESGEYSPILYNTKRLLVEQTGTYWLSKTPDVVSKDWASACRRIATWAIFRDKVTQARFLYTNTHLDHISDSARENQMMVIKQKMKEIIAKNGNMPMMLTGDFNVVQSKATYTKAASYLIPMNDAWLTAKEKSGSGMTFPSSEEISSSTPRKIDFIMLSKEITTEKAYTGESELPSGQILSDHNPHWADITWETTDEEEFRVTYNQGKDIIDSTVVYTKGTTKLITNATDGSPECQISCDAAEEGSLVKNMIDGNGDTYFHSKWSAMPPNNPHYLQVDLKQDVRAIHFTYQRRNSATYGVADRWEEIMITASNDKENWDYITQLYEFGADEFATYASPVINMHKPYRYVRFNIMHTPAMKIRNANPQFTCSEFMVYKDELQTSKSQYYYNEELKNAVDALTAQNDIVEQALRSGTLTDEIKQSYINALKKVQSLYVDYNTLNAAVEKAQKLYSTFTAGTTRYGQVERSIRDKFKTIYTQVKNAYKTLIPRATADSLLNVLDEATNNFLAARKTFKTDKWYYIQNRQAGVNNSKGNLYGHVLYSGDNGSTATIKNGLYHNSKMTSERNPQTMWRIVSTDNGFALQNRASGYYLGGLYKDGTKYVMSAKPVAFDIDLFGVDDFHFTDNSTSNVYVSASEDGTAAPSDGGYHSSASWTLIDVNDSTAHTVQLPITNHTITFKTLPYPFVNKNTADGIHTYTLVDMPSANVYAMKEKNEFAAGEPFVMMAGSITDLDDTSTDTLYFDVASPNEFTTTPLVVNGMYGMLDNGTMAKLGYYLSHNKLRYGKATLDAQTGYIYKAQVKKISDSYDMTISPNQGISGISQASVKQAEEQNDIYTLDGKLLKSQVNTKDVQKQLPSGIYIIGKQKILVP